MMITGILMAEDLRKLAREIRHRHHEGDGPPYEMPIPADPPSEEDRRWMAWRLTLPIASNPNYPEPEPSLEEKLQDCLETWRPMTKGDPNVGGDSPSDHFHDYKVMAFQLRHSSRFVRRIWRLEGPASDTDLADDVDYMANAETSF